MWQTFDWNRLYDLKMQNKKCEQNKELFCKFFQMRYLQRPNFKNLLCSGDYIDDQYNSATELCVIKRDTKRNFRRPSGGEKMRVLRYVTQVPTGTYLGQCRALRSVTEAIYLPTYPKNRPKVRYVIWTRSLIRKQSATQNHFDFR